MSDVESKSPKITIFDSLHAQPTFYTSLVYRSADEQVNDIEELGREIEANYPVYYDSPDAMRDHFWLDDIQWESLDAHRYNIWSYFGGEITLQILSGVITHYTKKAFRYFTEEEGSGVKIELMGPLDEIFIEIRSESPSLLAKIERTYYNLPFSPAVCETCNRLGRLYYGEIPCVCGEWDLIL